jgi:hypothetical protein
LGVDVRVQEDAQEFKGSLFGALEDALDAALDAKAQGLGTPTAAAAAAAAKGASTAFAALEAPFRGVLLNSITSEGTTEGPGGEGFVKRWEEPFMELSVDVGLNDDDGGDGTIEGALGRYFADEVLEGPNAYRAPKAHGGLLKRARKGVALLAPPEVLHVHLKRFAYDHQKGGKGLEKKGNRVAFGLDLDLSPWTVEAAARHKGGGASAGGSGGSGGGSAVPGPAEPAEAATEARYRLHAVVVHSGGAGAGHYYAYVNHGGQGQDTGWAKCDDVRVSAVPAQMVLDDGAGGKHPAAAATKPAESTGAYLLQYVRADAIPALVPSLMKP